jgi:metal-responsive CopG/Arc/MetJ family transcriptional regulator
LRKTLIKKEVKEYMQKGKMRRMSEYVTIKIPAELISLIDEATIKKVGYSSRTEFIKDAIRRMLQDPDYQRLASKK